MTTTVPTVLTIREEEVLQRQATHIIGTLGHVSEGKSTLIRALTGIKTQRYSKEQERNITIHLGYANCKVWQNTVTGELRALQLKDLSPEPVADWQLIAHLSFADCPGHEAFLATMLGGASIMDSACLIIAANQDIIPQPQTLEHLIAAELMGLTRIAIVQNKLDLIDTAAAATANEGKIRGFVTDTCAGAAPLFPISAQHGWGVHSVLDYLLSLPPPTRDLKAPAALTCVRSFDINRPGPVTVGSHALVGTVIGGTLQYGVLAVDDWIEVRPGVLTAGPDGSIVAQPIFSRVRGIRCEGVELPYAIPGSLIAIATDLDPALGAGNGMIGQRIGVPGTLPPIVGDIQLKFMRLKRDMFKFGRYHVGDRVRVCSGVMTAEATVTEIDEKKRVRLRLDRPLCLGHGERVAVLRRHEEAGRELLEGTGEVRRLWEWSAIRIADTAAAEAATPPARTIEWVPLERAEFARPAAPAYSVALDYIMSRKEDLVEAAGALRFQQPETDSRTIAKHVIWRNWLPTVTLLDEAGVGDIAYRTHFHAYLDRDLSTTSAENGDSELVIKGRWRTEDIRNVLRKYVATYKRCTGCRGYNTGLIRAPRGLVKMRCARCVADNVIDE
jgi:translation initiation factor 2 subunit 3